MTTGYERRPRPRFGGSKAGKGRKTANRVNGTTPVFPIHTPEVDAQAPAAQVAPKTP